MTEQPRRRTNYLLGGRRLLVADLIDAGALRPGDTLVFRRQRSGEVHRAEVLADGSLRLSDGREFRSPSSAAAGAAAGSFDGWTAWALETTGESLDRLRSALLDEVVSHLASGNDPEDAGTLGVQTRHEWLRGNRDLADAGAPVSMAVRELVARWGVSARGSVVSQRIEDELADHKLVTSPSFRAVGLDTLVSLVHAPAELLDDTEVAVETARDGAGVEIGLTLGNIPAALNGLTSISPDATFEAAITIMRLNDFSQLAALEGPRKLVGAVTWRSIADVRHRLPSATLRDAIVPTQEASYDDELIDVLDRLYQHDFVLVRNERKEFVGIVTTADVVGAYGALATPFFLVGEIDRRLRWLLAQTFPQAEIASICDPGGDRVRSVDDLTFGDYEWLLQKPEHWARLGWPLDRAVFVQRLGEIREQRNDLAHFNPDPLPSGAVPRMRHFLKLLRELSE